MAKTRQTSIIVIASLMLSMLTATAYAQTLKYTIDTGARGQELFPVIGDIDNDGTQEIVTVAANKLVVINGKTGKTEWTRNDAYHKAAELALINSDRVPDILYTTSGPTIKAVRGNGSTIWQRKTSGDGQPMFPILTTDKNIYFATEDNAPFPYDPTATYRGAVTRIDLKGNIKATHWLEHPCWGGMAYYDGIIYVSDRRAGYGGFSMARGIQALNATTLKEIWARPEMMHSSNIPIIADYDGNGEMEIIATPLNKGAVILDAKTGKTIKDYSSRSTNSHGTATVHDIDNDGNAEIIQAGSYPSTVSPYFTVTDLVTGDIEFKPTLEKPAAWPPQLGDINNDGKMELLVATGWQGFTSMNRVYIYNNKYELIKTFTVTGAGLPIKTYDVDSDGKLEMIVPTYAGKIYVYNLETKSYKMDTFKQFYSNNRQGWPMAL